MAALFLLLFAVFLGLSGDVSQVDFGRSCVLVGIVGIRGKVIVFITLTFSKNEGFRAFLERRHSLRELSTSVDIEKCFIGPRRRTQRYPVELDEGKKPILSDPHTLHVAF